MRVLARMSPCFDGRALALRATGELLNEGCRTTGALFSATQTSLKGIVHGFYISGFTEGGGWGRREFQPMETSCGKVLNLKDVSALLKKQDTTAKHLHDYEVIHPVTNMATC